MAYNAEHNIVPKQIQKQIGNDLALLGKARMETRSVPHAYTPSPESTLQPLSQMVAETTEAYSIETRIENLRKAMKKAAAELDFTTAALIRDEMLRLEAQRQA